MIISKQLTIPSNTQQTSLYRQNIDIPRGFIYKIDVEFPAGCLGLVGVRVSDGGHQLWPYDMDEFFVSDDYVISFDDSYLKTEPPFQLQLFGYNEDDTYDHTISLRFGIVDTDIFIARYLPSYAYDIMQKMLTAEEKQAEKTLTEKVKSFFSSMTK